MCQHTSTNYYIISSQTSCKEMNRASNGATLALARFTRCNLHVWEGNRYCMFRVTESVIIQQEGTKSVATTTHKSLPEHNTTKARLLLGQLQLTTHTSPCLAKPLRHIAREIGNRPAATILTFVHSATFSIKCIGIHSITFSQTHCTIISMACLDCGL